MSDDEALFARLRTQVNLQGEGSLNKLDRWRWQEMERADERKRLARQEHMEQKRVAVAAVTDEVAELRADLEVLIDAYNESIGTINENLAAAHRTFGATDARADRQDEVIRQLKAEIVGLQVKAAEQRIEALDALHRNLVAAAGATINAFNDAANRRTERAEVEEQQRAELSVVEAKANALAAELERLREAQKNVKFAREQQDDEDLDLPRFLLPSRNVN